MDLNSSPSHFPTHQISHDNDHEPYYLHQPFLPNFFNLTQDHTRFYDHSDDQNYGGLKLGLWKKEHDEGQSKRNPVKWMSSKMRVMQKMKHADHDRAARNSTSSGDRTVQISSSDLSSNSSSYNNSPIRVCSDCNTTKTPLWRSGPKGPKSLCNACGIRQRKARRAMAAAAAANGATTNIGNESPVKDKLQHKGKDQNGHALQLAKRCKTVATATNASAEQKQLGLEDFSINLSKNLPFYRVFPDDEKDAAILLMALSSGLVNG